MKICLLNNLYHPYQRGGAETVVDLSAQELQRQGQDVFLITTKPPFNKEKNRKLSVYYLRSCYYYLSRLPLLFRMIWHIWDMFNFKNYFLIKRILEREKPDIIITHNLKGIGFLSLLAIKNTSAIHVHTLHDIQLLHPSGLLIWGEEKKLHKFSARLYMFLVRKLIRSPNAVLSPSSWLLDMHVQKKFFPRSRKKVLPNPIPPGSKDREKLNWDKNFFYFIYVGQLEKHKGILFLIDAFKQFQKRFPDKQTKLIVVGGGSLFKKAYKTSHPNHIIFTGKKTATQVRGIMDEANCLIIPSWCYENSPTVIYEAIESGLPIIASELGGIPEIAQQGAAELFTPGKREELISQMKKIQENHSWFQRLARNKKEKTKDLGVENYVRKLLAFIENRY